MKRANKARNKKGRVEELVKKFPFETRRILVGILIVFVGIMLISGFTGGWGNLTGMITGNFKSVEGSSSVTGVASSTADSGDIVQQCKDACMKNDRNAFCDMQRALKQVNEKGEVMSEEKVTCNMLANEARFSVFGVTRDGCGSICEMNSPATAPPMQPAPPITESAPPIQPENPTPPMPESAPPQPATPPENMPPAGPAPPLP